MTDNPKIFSKWTPRDVIDMAALIVRLVALLVPLALMLLHAH